MTGYGSGYGDGSGDGYGYGDGSGDGYGYVDGDGDGYGVTVGTAGPYAVSVPWPGYVRVGCQLRSIDEWRASWFQSAIDEGIAITPDEALALIAAASAVTLADVERQLARGGK